MANAAAAPPATPLTTPPTIAPTWVFSIGGVCVGLDELLLVCVPTVSTCVALGVPKALAVLVVNASAGGICVPPEAPEALTVLTLCVDEDDDVTISVVFEQC